MSNTYLDENGDTQWGSSRADYAKHNMQVELREKIAKEIKGWGFHSGLEYSEEITIHTAYQVADKILALLPDLEAIIEHQKYLEEVITVYEKKTQDIDQLAKEENASLNNWAKDMGKLLQKGLEHKFKQDAEITKLKTDHENWARANGYVKLEKVNLPKRGHDYGLPIDASQRRM